MSEQVKMATCMAIRAAIDGITEIMGENGAKVIFRDIGLGYLIEKLPEYSWDPCIPTTEQVKIYSDIIPMLGLNGAVSIWRRIGYTNIKYVVEIGHAIDHLADLPAREKFFKATESFTLGTGKGKAVPNDETGADLDVFDCLLCEGHASSRPICSLYEGVLLYLCEWAYGKGVYVPRETTCMAKGDKSCYFVLTPK
jgi:predicted hydrocarbon binding protein